MLNYFKKVKRPILKNPNKQSLLLLPQLKHKVFQIKSSNTLKNFNLMDSVVPSSKVPKFSVSHIFNEYLVFRQFRKNKATPIFSENVINSVKLCQNNELVYGYKLKEIKGGFLFCLGGFISFVPRSLVHKEKNGYYRILKIKIMKKKVRFRKNSSYRFNLVSSSKEND